MIVPPPPPAYTLAPGVAPLEPGQQSALDACLAQLTGRLGGVVVTWAATGDSHHVIELLTPAGTLLVVARLTGTDANVAPVTEDDTGQRLEMLLVMQWLDEGADDEGAVALSVATAASELGLEAGAGLLAVMSALGDLEDRRVVDVTWPAGAAGGEATVTLSPEVRRDARRLFGRS